jgi:hypothetical protein
MEILIYKSDSDFVNYAWSIRMARLGKPAIQKGFGEFGQTTIHFFQKFSKNRIMFPFMIESQVRMLLSF